MSLARNALKGGLWMVGIRYPIFCFNFLSNLVLSRLLAPEAFGLFALAFSIAEIVFVLGSMGFSQACVQINDEDDVFDTTYTITWLWSIGVFLISLMIAWMLSDVYGALIIKILALLCAGKSLELSAMIYIAHLNKELYFKRSALIEGLSNAFGISTTLILAFVGFGLWALFARELITVLTLYLMAITLSGYKARFRINKRTAKRVMRFSANLLLSGVSDRLIAQGPKLFLGTVTGVRILAPFERGQYLVNVASRLFNQFYAQVGFPVFAKAQNEPEKLSRGLGWNLFFIIRAAGLMALITGLFSAYLFTSLLGSQWAYGAHLFQGFCLFLLFQPLYIPMKTVILAIDQGLHVSLASVIKLLVLSIGVGLAYYENNWALLSWALGASIGAATLYLIYIGRCHQITVNWIELLAIPSLAAAASLTWHWTLGWNVDEMTDILSIMAIWGFICLIFEHKRYQRVWRLVIGQSVQRS